MPLVQLLLFIVALLALGYAAWRADVRIGFAGLALWLFAEHVLPGLIGLG